MNTPRPHDDMAARVTAIRLSDTEIILALDDMTAMIQVHGITTALHYDAATVAPVITETKRTSDLNTPHHKYAMRTSEILRHYATEAIVVLYHHQNPAALALDHPGLTRHENYGVRHSAHTGLVHVPDGMDPQHPGTPVLVPVVDRPSEDAVMVREQDGRLIVTPRTNIDVVRHWELRITRGDQPSVALDRARVDDPAGLAALVARALSLTDPETNLVEAYLLT